MKIADDIRIREEEFGAVIRIPKRLKTNNKNQFYAINKTALFILKSFLSLKDENAVFEHFKEMYNDQTDLKKDFEIFVSQLAEIGIIDLEEK